MAIDRGTRIGPYTILDSLGAGGMGEVYVALDKRLNRKVALKFLHADFTKDEERVRRFQQEARAVSALNHPNLITILDIGEFESTYFIATEFVEGQTLRQRMASGPISIDDICDIAAQVAGALERAGSEGIVHRDIKPENIMVRDDGYVKVLDFGLAKLTQPESSEADTGTLANIEVSSEPGPVMGMLHYLSPEQALGAAVDARTDIFSFGVVLYEMIAGRVPFSGVTLVDVISDILYKRPAPLFRTGVPRELERIVMKALEKNPDERYQTIKDLEIDLKRLKQRLVVRVPTYHDVDESRAPGVSRRREMEEVDLETAPVEPIQGKKGQTLVLWYGTNRKLIHRADDTVGFSSDRGNQVTVGRCLVYVPESHNIGSLGSSWWRRLLTWRDDRLKLIKTIQIESSIFWQLIKKELDKLGQENRRALIYIHGFNVTFEEAALRAAQLGGDLGVRGLLGFYSWPSKGSLLGYQADGASIDASEDFIADFLTSFAIQSGVERIHVIAHSMGNRGLLRAMHRILEKAERDSTVKFGQIFLAAPDVDRELFLNLADCYPKLSARTTLYISDKDRALRSSGIIHDFPRAGFTPPVTTAPGIDTVEVSNIDLTLLGHGFFANARDVLHDMHNLIMNNAAPDSRMGLRKNKAHDDDTAVYWSIKA